MRKLILLTFLIFVFCVSKAKVSEGKNPYRIMFYNVENYFDTKDDPEKNDNDFLPESKKHWTYNKMEEKRNSIAKVITAVGEGMPVAIVGMCEVENDYFLTSSHEMTKEHYISFAAYITYSGMQIKKLYPEQEPEVRFPFSGKGKIFFFCNRDGLFETDL